MDSPRWVRVVAVHLAAVGIFAGGLAACDDSATATPPTTAEASPSGVLDAVTSAASARHIDGPFFGFNGASIVQNANIDLLLDPALQRRLARFPTRLIRVPSGTAAQWIDWRTGRFVPRPDSPFAKVGADRRAVTMSDWATLIRTTGATPVWDLNVLTSSLDEQVAMLEAAEHLGMPVRYIELGNELWDVRSIYPRIFPTGATYGAAMNAWITALRARFPGAHIAVSGADPSDPFFATVFGQRYREWNAQLLSTVRGADAIAIHPYWTLPERATPGSDIPATLTAGLDAWARFTADVLTQIPKGMAVWLTEWNQAAWGSSQGTQIWAQALSVVAVGLSQLSEPRVTMSLVHDIVDGVRNPHDAGISTTFPAFADGADGSTPLAPTALGFALPELFATAPAGARAQRLDVEGAPRVGAHPGVAGVQVIGRRTGALLVNLTSQSIVVRLPRSLHGRCAVRTVRAPLDAQPGWRHGAEPTVESNTSTGTVRLPAAAVVRLSSCRSAG